MMTRILFAPIICVLVLCIYLSNGHEDVIDASQLLDGFPSQINAKGGSLSFETKPSEEMKSNFATGSESRSSYGLDYSFPAHHTIENRDSHHHKRYVERFLGGCHRKHDQSSCDLSEMYRKYRNLHIPELKTNYTDTGFLKLKAPAAVSDGLMDLFEANKHKAVKERWMEGKTHTNHWETPPSLLSWERPDAIYGGDELRDLLEEEIQPIMAKFVNSGSGGTGKALGDSKSEEGAGADIGEGALYRRSQISPSGLYGIRIFKTGAVVAPHLDHLPLALTALICVAQELEVPWPLEIFSHGDNAAVNITLNPGEMVLYEGHSVIHGNPFPLQGKYAAFMYLHFVPRDYYELNTVDDPDLLRVFEHLQPGVRSNTDDFATDDMAPDAEEEGQEQVSGQGSLKESRRHIPTRRELNNHIRFIYNYEPQPLFLGGEED